MSGDDGNTERRVVVVAGGASGIGRACVDRFASGGNTVVSVDIADQPHSDSDSIVRRSCDVTSTDDVRQLIDSVTSDFGRIDGIVCAAGTSSVYSRLVDLDVEQFDNTVAVNLRAPFLMMKFGLGALEKTSGSFTTIGSGAGRRGFAKLCDYVATKHGVIGLSRSAALEYARAGVRVNVVCPGTVRTPMLIAFAGSERGAEKMGELAPMGRIGEPHEIADAVFFLASSSASFLTGVVLDADGGVSAT